MFMLGFLGTAHCLGMCGPLVIALPGQFGRWQAHLVYHLGRITTYGLTGALLGGLGSGMSRAAVFTHSSSLAWGTRLQMAISLLAALFLILFGLNRLGLLREPDWLSKIGPQNLPRFAQALLRALKERRLPVLLIIGLFLGLLPCGLSYAAFARTLAAGGFLSGGLLAVLFGLGTLPGLLIVGTGGGALLRRFRVQADMLSGVIMIGMAVSLVVKILRVHF